MTVEQQRRLEMFIAVLGCPVAAAGAWTLGLRLAAAGLGAVWLVLVVLYVIDHVRHANDTTASALPAAPPLSAPAVVDPARALLDALGDDLTGGRS